VYSNELIIPGAIHRFHELLIPTTPSTGLQIYGACDLLWLNSRNWSGAFDCSTCKTTKPYFINRPGWTVA